MATREDQETLRTLVQHVSRAFYDAKFVIIMDQLSRQPVLKDDDLAGRIGLQAKELNKLMAVLTNDRLVQVHRQNELKDGAQRSIGKQYYFIDYQHFCNVVKWRVAEMRRKIDSTLRNELDNKGYICPNCKATFLPLEADRLMDFMRGTFICDQCPTSPGGPHEVVLNEDEETVRGSKDRMERFMKQTQWIQDGLRKSEAMTMPAFDVAVWVKNHVTEDKQKQTTSGGLKIAGSDGKRAEESIGVVLSVDKDEATRRKEREAEAEVKRQQNVMPSWHLKSTISNDLTALGIAASGHTNGNGSLGNSNANILNGLGKAKPQPKLQQSEAQVVEEKKPVVEHNADFYDQYYAALEAASRSQSTTQTPIIESLGSDFDEEERKPNVQYLDSLAATRKRSRSREDDGERFSKALRSNAGTPAFSRSPSGLTSAVDSPSPFPELGPAQSSDDSLDAEPMQTDPAPIGQAPADDPIVMVGGNPMPFSQVTQEIADEKMSPEEYTAWAELLMA